MKHKYTQPEIQAAIKALGPDFLLPAIQRRTRIDRAVTRRFATQPSRRPASSTSDEYRTAFVNAVIRGVPPTDREASLLTAEYRDLGVAAGATGGYTVPQAFFGELTQSLTNSSAIRSVCRVVTTTTGATMPLPTVDDTAHAAGIQTENVVVAEGPDPAFAQKSLNSFVYGTGEMLKTSRQFAADNGLDLAAELAQLMGARLARAQNPHFTNGTGGGTQPLGVMTNVATGVVLPTGHTTTLTYAGLFALYLSVSEVYRKNGTFMCNSNTLAQVFGVVDSNNRPVLQLPTQPGPLTLFGRPIVVNDDMASPAANAKTVVFGDFKRGYIVRDIVTDFSLRLLAERYADQFQYAWLGFGRADASPLDSAALACLQHSAT